MAILRELVSTRVPNGRFRRMVWAGTANANGQSPPISRIYSGRIRLRDDLHCLAKRLNVWRKDHRNLDRLMLTYRVTPYRAGQTMRKLFGTAALLTAFAT